MMAFGSPSSQANVSSNLKGYSDFFASGFSAVSTKRPRRPTSIISSPSGSAVDSENCPPPLLIAHPYAKVSSSSTPLRRSRQRPVSLITMPSRSTPTESPSGRRSFTLPFSRFLSGTGTASSSLQKVKPTRSSRGTKARAADSWICTTGDSRLPSVNNGGSESTRSQVADPFHASPDSKSFFIDLSDHSPSPSSKRKSFLSISSFSARSATPSAATSSSGSFINVLPRRARERPASIQTAPAQYASGSRRSSRLSSCSTSTSASSSSDSSSNVSSSSSSSSSSPPRTQRHHVHSFLPHPYSQEKPFSMDFWILEEEESTLLPSSSQPTTGSSTGVQSQNSYYETHRDSDDDSELDVDVAARIDWRQFHYDILNVEA